MDFAQNAVAYSKRLNVLKTILESLGKSRDVIHLSILLTVALCVGLYLIVTTAIIAKDGITFIEYAQRLNAAPAETMVNEFQHPGYPWLILVAHKVAFSLRGNTSLLSWIYCGQAVALIFRLFALTALFFIGKRLFGGRLSFWGVLILILLPEPAEYGSDALSDWPSLFFLLAGILFLFEGAANKRWWMFGFSGLAGGMGYLIRPECAQLIVLGVLWLGLQFLWPKSEMSRGKIVYASILMLLGFLAVAGPYMKLKGAVFPKKNIGQFSRNTSPQESHAENHHMAQSVIFVSKISSLNVAKAFRKLVSNVGETLMWIFLPAMLIGMRTWFKKQRGSRPEGFFIIALILLNIPVMVWLYCRHGYMSDRHTLPLLIIPILYIPVGLQELAIWLQKRFPRKSQASATENRIESFWFLLLLLMGVSICIPKLLRPIRSEKQGYRSAAEWLKANTDGGDIIAVPDKRIHYYAERKGLVYENGNIPANIAYIVTLSKKENNETVFPKPFGEAVYTYIDKTSRGKNVTIYKNL